MRLPSKDTSTNPSTGSSTVAASFLTENRRGDNQDEGFLGHRRGAYNALDKRFPGRGREMTTSGVSSSPSSRPRSLSAGRSRIRNNNIVQDVYDRMGVNYKRGEGVPLEDTAGTANNNDRPVENYRFARGRVMEITTEAERRSRSLSQGRTKKRWGGSSNRETFIPSYQPNETTARPITPTRMSPTRPARFVDPKSQSGMSSASTKRGSGIQTTSGSRSPFQAKPKGRVSAVVGSSYSKNGGGAVSNGSNYLGVEKVPTQDSEDADDEEAEVQTVRSLKDRISAYGNAVGHSSSVAKSPLSQTRNGVKSCAATDFNSNNKPRDFPPKIDIYGPPRQRQSEDEDEKKEEAYEDDGIMLYRRSSSFKEIKTPTSALTCQPRKKENLSSSSHSTKTGNRGLAGAFLAAIQTSDKATVSSAPKRSYGPSSTWKSSTSKGAPVSEIAASPSTEDEVAAGMGSDNASLTMSSVSGDEFGDKVSPFLGKKPSWQERNRVSVYSGHLSPSVGGAKLSVSDSMVEKMVEDRVQAHVAGLEHRMEEKWKKFMQQMEDKITARLDDMEEKLLRK